MKLGLTRSRIIASALFACVVVRVLGALAGFGGCSPASDGGGPPVEPHVHVQPGDGAVRGAFVDPFDYGDANVLRWDQLARAMFDAGIRTFVIQATSEGACNDLGLPYIAPDNGLSGHVAEFVSSLPREDGVRVYFGTVHVAGPNGAGRDFWQDAATKLGGCWSRDELIDASAEAVGRAQQVIDEAGAKDLYAGCYITNEVPVVTGAVEGIGKFLAAGLEACRGLNVTNAMDPNAPILMSPTVNEDEKENTAAAAREFGDTIAMLTRQRPDVRLVVAMQDGVGAHTEDPDAATRFRKLQVINSELRRANAVPWINLEAFEKRTDDTVCSAEQSRFATQLHTARRGLDPVPATILFFDARHIFDPGRWCSRDASSLVSPESLK